MKQVHALEDEEMKGRKAVNERVKGGEKLWSSMERDLEALRSETDDRHRRLITLRSDCLEVEDRARQAESIVKEKKRELREIQVGDV